MRHTRRYGWLLFAGVLAAGAVGPGPVAWGQSVVPALLDESEVRALVAEPPQTAPEEAGAEYLYLGERVLLQPDGRRARREHRVVRLLSGGAIGELGDPRIRFDAQSQELIVHRCRTYTPRGEVLDAPPRARNQVTPGAAARCPGALRYQDLVLTHVGLEPGCVIELDVEIRGLRSDPTWLEGRTRIHEVYPVRRRELVVETPSHLTLQTVSLGTASPARVRQREGRTTHHWRWETLPAVRETDDGCDGWRTRGAVFYTTCASWDYLARSMRDRFAEAVRVDSLMTLRLAIEEYEARSPRERAAALLPLSGREVRAADLSPAPVPELQPAPRTFASRCGSRWDRAALAMSLLAAVGVNTEPVLAGHRWGESSRVPMAAAFEDLWLRAIGEAAPLWLDPIGETVRVDPPAGRDLLVLTADGPRWVARGAGAGRSRVEVDLEVRADGHVLGTAIVRVAGHTYDPEPWRDVTAMAEQVAAGLLPEGRAIGGELLWHTPDSCGLRVELEADALGTWEGDRGYLALTAGPAPVAAIVPRDALRRVGRTTPLFLPGPAREHVTWSVRLPAAIHPVYVPPAAAEAYRAGQFVCDARVADRPAARWASGPANPGGTRVVVEWTLALPMEQIPPARMGELQTVMDRYRAENQRLLILGTTGE